MRLSIPLTGKVREFYPDGNISGDLDDPVRMVNINLGMVHLHLIEVDLENDVGIWEVTPVQEVAVPVLDGQGVQEVDSIGEPIFTTRKATEQEKQERLNNARAMIESKTTSELYSEAGSSSLIKQQKHVDDYRKYKAGKGDKK